MNNPLPCRILSSSAEDKSPQSAALLERQWLVTNGLGGYATGTIGGVNTWHYHGLLISSEAAPLGRMMMLEYMFEKLHFANGETVCLCSEERAADQLDTSAFVYLEEFRLEGGLPVWRYRIGSFEFERAVVMQHRQNTVYITYRVLHCDGPVQLELMPAIWFRSHEATYDQAPHCHDYILTALGNRYEIVATEGKFPTLRLSLSAERFSFTSNGGMRREVYFRKDAARGYNPRGVLWSPGYFTIELSQGQEIALTASTEPWKNIEALKPAEAIELERERRKRLLGLVAEPLRDGFPAELVLAADQFLFEPVSRYRERIRALATGEEVRAVIAGYHWFTDWGRDTLISLEGLTLVTGRYEEAKAILTALARYMRDGLLPNLFPDGAEEGLYHTADATLWFFHAVDRYLDYTQDKTILSVLMPQLESIIDHHIRGTHFGIGIDERDGLLRQGKEGYQLTWMDAKVDGWVVTPRRGKAVEINALWHNALCLMAGWAEGMQMPDKASEWKERAAKAKQAFNQRFWYAEGGYLYDVVDGENGDDPACRPNQLLSFSLRHPVLDHDKWEQVLQIAKEKLLTPLGLRSLSPGHPDYKSRYFGDLRSRDAAYHQGTVWPWLIGPFIDAWLAVYPDDLARAHRFLGGFVPHLNDACIGSINEICDAEAPYKPRGCISQAWSVAEVLRCWRKTNML